MINKIIATLTLILIPFNTTKYEKEQENSFALTLNRAIVSFVDKIFPDLSCKEEKKEKTEDRYELVIFPIIFFVSALYFLYQFFFGKAERKPIKPKPNEAKPEKKDINGNPIKKEEAQSSLDVTKSEQSSSQNNSTGSSAASGGGSALASGGGITPTIGATPGFGPGGSGAPTAGTPPPPPGPGGGGGPGGAVGGVPVIPGVGGGAFGFAPGFGLGAPADGIPIVEGGPPAADGLAPGIVPFLGEVVGDGGPGGDGSRAVSPAGGPAVPDIFGLGRPRSDSGSTYISISSNFSEALSRLSSGRGSGSSGASSSSSGGGGRVGLQPPRLIPARAPSLLPGGLSRASIVVPFLFMPGTAADSAQGLVGWVPGAPASSTGLPALIPARSMAVTPGGQILDLLDPDGRIARIPSASSIDSLASSISASAESNPRSPIPTPPNTPSSAFATASSGYSFATANESRSSRSSSSHHDDPHGSDRGDMQSGDIPPPLYGREIFRTRENPIPVARAPTSLVPPPPLEGDSQSFYIPRSSHHDDQHGSDRGDMQSGDIPPPLYGREIFRTRETQL